MLINISRSSLVDAKAFVDCHRSGEILDIYKFEEKYLAMIFDK
jgi:lactate dehydrogenase-like 2-hydroxyacid dehydrogenase